MKLKTLFVALVAVCIAIALAAAQPSAAGPGKGQGKAKANAAVVKKGHDKANGHQNSGGHKAGKGHSDEAGAEEAAPEQPTTEDSSGAGGAEADVAVEEEPKNAAHECKSERDEMGEDAFAGAYGKNENKRNAFGKCVSQKAHERNGGGEEAATETDADEAATGETTEGAPAGTTEGGATGAGATETESSVPDGADAHERQQDQLADLILRLEELLADLKAQLGGASAPAPATP
jgi:hypothetical protein